ncbi:hypothetical protein Rleg4DRAFT_1503 [Rhizobium leguminosarum bv. trifolii WSM2297]|uniref:Uncharacterized protein n=1 Tax=Rhizobium leguminosarum bv. trifolii WSM2297 TaxID=754762 RepID=J0W412_RHILT|nr:hypothetical protein Rleg4DRAFT_1503 [Rhizobium leguminosarum bv. trifolii WSM2297]
MAPKVSGGYRYHRQQREAAEVNDTFPCKETLNTVRQGATITVAPIAASASTAATIPAQAATFAHLSMTFPNSVLRRAISPRAFIASGLLTVQRLSLRTHGLL